MKYKKYMLNEIRDGRIDNGINPANFMIVCILKQTSASFRSFSSASFPKDIDWYPVIPDGTRCVGITGIASRQAKWHCVIPWNRYFTLDSLV